MLRVSVDIGGTFTDMVVTDPDGGVSMFKAPSTPGQLSNGVMDCQRQAAPDRGTTLGELLATVDPIIHGTTATTNVSVEGTARDCGVAIDPMRLVVDEAATRRLRATLAEDDRVPADTYCWKTGG